MSTASANTAKTTDTSVVIGAGPRLELDPALYDLTPGEKAFFAHYTGIRDDEALKEHILACQAKAYAVHPYPCIRLFAFLRLRIVDTPGYQALLQMGRERPDALFVEFASCFGQELRRAIYDGFPLSKTIATDLHTSFWTLGHALFTSTPATFPVPLVPADVLSDTARSRPPRPSPPTPPRPRPAPTSARSLLSRRYAGTRPRCTPRPSSTSSTSRPRRASRTSSQACSAPRRGALSSATTSAPPPKAW